MVCSWKINNSSVNRDLFRRRCQEKNEELSARLVSASLARDEAKRQLHRSMCLVRDLVLEQESLVRALQERQQENEAVAKLGTSLLNRVGNLKSKLKVSPQFCCSCFSQYLASGELSHLFKTAVCVLRRRMFSTVRTRSWT